MRPSSFVPIQQQARRKVSRMLLPWLENFGGSKLCPNLWKTAKIRARSRAQFDELRTGARRSITGTLNHGRTGVLSNDGSYGTKLSKNKIIRRKELASCVLHSRFPSA